MTHKAKRCRECGEGTILPVRKAGRRAPYKNMFLEVPFEVPVPTCNHCGVEWVDAATANAIDTALEAIYAAELQKRLSKALDRILQLVDVPQRRLETLLGLSQGYLSKVKGESGGPSAQLVSALALLAEDPKRRVKELETLWGDVVTAA